ATLVLWEKVPRRPQPKPRIGAAPHPQADRASALGPGGVWEQLVLFSGGREPIAVVGLQDWGRGHLKSRAVAGPVGQAGEEEVMAVQGRQGLTSIQLLEQLLAQKRRAPGSNSNSPTVLLGSGPPPGTPEPFPPGIPGQCFLRLLLRALSAPVSGPSPGRKANNLEPWKHFGPQ
ncbi:hypothetical protein MC885_010025, partial [Smutsia gigantea]